ncbi:DNA sulfur modification protein DndB [Burkholderia sp. AU18528]|uniref:DNA sulfur modification protein DndB n=1 Tax=Burkholderia TaxID=32008 RepID=UPI000C08751E|nr:MULTISPECIES: DNA sulfur modification protein DndB [Burkholderia]MDF3113106.1 DNA sulfur modification protein DndB [Burkholderia semiarida]PHP91275.1 DNA sulfur modification protein DndB [Burkholderia sp. AU18528]
MDEQGYFHTFPAAQGRQAGRDFFIAMCPLRMVPRLFVFDEEEVPPELRAQRTLNRARVPEIAHYLTSNPTSYVLSALTASVDARVRFVPYDTGSHTSLGHLQIPMDARILINDGQHRRAAIEEAIREMPELGQDNVPVLFFVDEGLVRSQQMFADLNKYAVRPSNSLGTLYDYRDPGSDLARYLAAECLAFRGLTEMEKSSISNRSTKLFTLSSIKHASRALLRKQQKDEVSIEEKLLAKEYWDSVAENIPDWGRARAKEASTAELRQEYVHAHGVTLHALGIAGAELLSKRPKNWKSALKALRQVDWSRSNHKVWEGRAMVHGRISKASTNVQLTANCIKTTLGLALSPDDKVLEQQVQ